jgi:hypothetical protein
MDQTLIQLAEEALARFLPDAEAVLQCRAAIKTLPYYEEWIEGEIDRLGGKLQRRNFVYGLSKDRERSMLGECLFSPLCSPCEIDVKLT